MFRINDYRNNSIWKEAMKKLQKENLTVNFIKLDVIDPRQRSETKSAIEQDFGHLGAQIKNPS